MTTCASAWRCAAFFLRSVQGRSTQAILCLQLIFLCFITISAVYADDCIPPSPPSGVITEAGDGCITVYWNSVNDATAGYGVNYSTTTSGVLNPPFCGGGGACSYTFTGLQNNVAYYFAVFALKPTCWSNPSSVVSRTLVLDPPTGISAYSGNGTITVMWNGSDHADYYGLNIGSSPEAVDSHASGTFDASTTQTYYTFSHTNGQPCFIRVYAANLGGVTPGSMVFAMPGQMSLALPPYADSATPYDAPPCGCGPSSGDPVDLTTQIEDYQPQPDLTVYNPSGPGVAFGREYRSDRAMSGLSSPGFPDGWSHSYDVTVIPTNASAWTPLTLTFGNGARDTITPILDGNGVPTGSFSVANGTPFYASGVASGTTGHWTSLSLTWASQVVWQFTPNGSGYVLSSVTDSLGHSISLTYDSFNRLQTITNPSASLTLLTCNYTDGLISNITDAYNRKVVYTMATVSGISNPCLTSISQIVDAGNNAPLMRWSHGYQNFHSMPLLNSTTVPSPTGVGTSTSNIIYDTLGNVTAVVDGNGYSRTYAKSTSATTVQVKQNGKVLGSVVRQFDSSRRETGSTDIWNHATSLAYADANNPTKPTQYTDENNKSVQATYDSYGNVTSTTTSRGLTTSLLYNYTSFVFGRLLSIQEGSNLANPKGPVSFTYYEPSGLVHTVTGPAPGSIGGSATVTSSFTYDALGNILTSVSPGNDATLLNGIDQGILSTFNYSADGTYSQTPAVDQPLVITDNLGKSVHFRYDARGNVLSATDALGYTVDFSYNIADQIVTITLPATGQTGTGRAYQSATYLYPGGPIASISTYDESGNLVKQVSYTRGLEGELLSVTGNTEPVSYAYDGLYRLTTLTDAAGHITRYFYRPDGGLGSVLYPGGDTIQLPSYDGAGNVLKRMDGRGVETDYVYDDPENLITDIQYPLNTAKNIHYTYDSFGRVATMTDGAGSTVYAYDDLDTITSVTRTYTGVPGKTITYSYYPDGNRASMITPAGTFTYGHDAVGRLTSVTNPFSEVDQAQYYDDGSLQRHTLGNGAYSDYTYDPIGELLGLTQRTASNNLLTSFGGMTYDGLGNRLTVSVNMPGWTPFSGTTTYTYDAASRLIYESSTRNGGFAQQFAYDNAGNSTTFRNGSHTFNSNNQDQGFTFDKNGNPISYRGVSLAFDEENRLVTNGQ